MNALSEYLRSRISKAIFHGETLELPTNISIALTTDVAEADQDGSTIPEVPTSISRSGVNEVGESGVYDYETGYSRVNVAIPQHNGTNKWSYQDGEGVIHNLHNLVFSTCLESWGMVSGVAILDNENVNTGNLLFYGELEFPRNVLEGDAVKFDAEKFEVYIK